MIEFETYKIGDVSSISAGGDAPQIVSDVKNAKFSIPIFSNGIDNEGLYGYTDKSKVEGDSITITARGVNIGTAFYRRTPFLPIVRLLSIVPNRSIIYPKYLYYYFKGIKIIGTGSAQPQIPVPFFSRKKIKIVKDINVQKLIADGLTQFDSLIENNINRIEILEQMATILYKEWFVKFRFPGHEKYRYIEKKPRGWELGDNKKTIIPNNWHFGELNELGNFVRGKNITAEKMVSGIVPVISAGISPSGYHNEYNVIGKSITISASGANAGYLQYHLDNIWAADCSYYQNEENMWFVYNSLKFLQPVISNMQAGAAQPHVYPKHVNRISMIIPEEKWIKKYCEMVEPIYEEIKMLRKKNDNLIKQRDLLLPRLMSGKLEAK